MVYSFALSQFYALLSLQKLRQRFPTAATAATYMRPRWGLWQEITAMLFAPPPLMALRTLRALSFGKNKRAVMCVENFTAPHFDKYFALFNIFLSLHRMKGFSNTYFGARYYTDNIMMWLSVDPMSDKYPSMSPYMYCAGNPIKFVDPDGMDIVNAYLEQKNKAQQRLDNARLKLNSFNGDKKVDGYRQALKEFKQAQRSYNRIEGLYNNTNIAISDLQKYNRPLYDQLDNLVDFNGNQVDVYVKITSGLNANGQSLLGKSTVSYNPSTCSFTSIYGENTSLIEIDNGVIDKGRILSHEGGHNVYTITNFIEYTKWLEAHPMSRDGHSYGNPSGKYANDMETIYMYNKNKK